MLYIQTKDGSMIVNMDKVINVEVIESHNSLQKCSIVATLDHASQTMGEYDRIADADKKFMEFTEWISTVKKVSNLFQF